MASKRVLLKEQLEVIPAGNEVAQRLVPAVVLKHAPKPITASASSPNFCTPKIRPKKETLNNNREYLRRHAKPHSTSHKKRFQATPLVTLYWLTSLPSEMQ